MIYPLFAATTEEEMALLEMYCAGRSFLWNIFFGWRKTTVRGNTTYYYYRVPRKIYNLCQENLKYFGIETI